MGYFKTTLIYTGTEFSFLLNFLLLPFAELLIPFKFFKKELFSISQLIFRLSVILPVLL